MEMSIFFLDAIDSYEERVFCCDFRAVGAPNSHTFFRLFQVSRKARHFETAMKTLCLDAVLLKKRKKRVYMYLKFSI